MNGLAIAQSFLCGLLFVAGAFVGVMVAAYLMRSVDRKRLDERNETDKRIAASLEKQSSSISRIADSLERKEMQ